MPSGTRCVLPIPDHHVFAYFDYQLRDIRYLCTYILCLISARYICCLFKPKAGTFFYAIFVENCFLIAIRELFSTPSAFVSPTYLPNDPYTLRTQSPPLACDGVTPVLLAHAALFPSLGVYRCCPSPEGPARTVALRDYARTQSTDSYRAVARSNYQHRLLTISTPCLLYS